MAAVNSYTLLDLADEVVAVQPDAVLIYAGHNEYVGALGAASSEALGGSPAVVRAYLRLRRFRTVQLVRNGLAAIQRASAAPEAGDGRPTSTLMSQMVGEQSVPLGSETYRRGLRQFEENLDLLLARYEAAGVPVFVGTLASNERDQRPFVVATAGPLSPEARARADRGRARAGPGRAGRGRHRRAARDGPGRHARGRRAVRARPGSPCDRRLGRGAGGARSRARPRRAPLPRPRPPSTTSSGASPRRGARPSSSRRRALPRPRRRASSAKG